MAADQLSQGLEYHLTHREEVNGKAAKIILRDLKGNPLKTAKKREYQEM